jgi:hypothetical protein
MTMLRPALTRSRSASVISVCGLASATKGTKDGLATKDTKDTMKIKDTKATTCGRREAAPSRCTRDERTTRPDREVVRSPRVQRDGRPALQADRVVASSISFCSFVSFFRVLVLCPSCLKPFFVIFVRARGVACTRDGTGTEWSSRRRCNSRRSAPRRARCCDRRGSRCHGRLSGCNSSACTRG